MKLPRSWLVLAAAAALSLSPALADAQRSEATEASVKAAFIFKFAGYVEWSPAEFASPEAPLVIGVAGSEEVASELERIASGRNVGGHPVAVKRLKEAEASRGVHMAFVGRAEGARMAAWLRAAQSHGALAITEVPRGLELGAAINFVVADERVGFEVSLGPAEKSGHRISSRMLAVARRVVPKAAP